MKPEELSEQLRQGSGTFLARRRKIAGLALTAAGSMALISLYQMGIIKHLPDPPLPGKLTADQIAKHRALCVWCLIAAGSTFAAVPLVVPEARAALGQVLGRKGPKCPESP